MKKALTLLTLLALAAPLAVRADGMIMPSPDYYMYEAGQRAVILYDEKSAAETLVVSIRFRGNAKDFAWIIPVPGEPTVSQGSEELFTSLAQLTNRGYEPGFLTEGSVGLGQTDEKDVDVIRIQTIDYYSVATLKSNDSRALANWLQENGYEYPTGSEYLLNSYVTNGWYFVAAKIDLSRIGESQAQEELREGYATPLKLVFSARNPVYPMRISSVTGSTSGMTGPIVFNVEESTGQARPDFFPPSAVSVELYVLAKHKQTIPNFSTSYGNWVKKKTIERWAVDDQGDPLLKPAAGKYFLTKLTRSMTNAQMTDDLFPRQAENDKKVGISATTDWTLANLLLVLFAVSVFTVIVFTVGLFSPFGIAFIIATAVQLRCRSRGWRIAAWAVQGVVTGLYAVIGLLLALLSFGTSSGFFSMPRDIIGSSLRYGADPSALWLFSLILPIGAFLALLVLTMIWQGRYRRRGLPELRS